MHNDVAPRAHSIRRVFATLGAFLLVATGGVVAAAPATADDPPPPISWEWTDAPYWQTSFQAGLPLAQQWLATTTGGGTGTVVFTAEPAGATTTALADLGLSVGNFTATAVSVGGVVPDEAPPGVYEYTITATGPDSSTDSRVLTVTIAPPLVTTGPPTFSGPTDWYVSSTGTYDFYPVVHEAETASVGFPTEPYDSIWSFCNASGSWWGGGPGSIGVHCTITTLPADGTYVFEVHAGNDEGSSVFTGRVHVGAFAAPTIDSASEVKVGAGNPFPALVPTLTGAPAPSVTIAPSGDNDHPLGFLGLSIDSATGAITGTIPASTPSGSYEYTLTATGAGVDTQALTIVVGRPPVVSGPTEVSGLPDADLGTLTWTWDPATVTGTAVVSGGLDDSGLTYTSTSCCATPGSAQISGVRISSSATVGTSHGDFMTLSNEFGTTVVSLSVTVGARPVIEPSTPGIIIASVGTAITDFTPTMTGGAATSFTLTKTSGPDLDDLLPTGLTFDSTTGGITGTVTDATQEGEYWYTLVAHGEFGDSAPHVFTIHVGTAPTVSPAVQDVYVLRGQAVPTMTVSYEGATGGTVGYSLSVLDWFSSIAVLPNSSGITYSNLVVRPDAPLGVFTFAPLAYNEFGFTVALVRVHVETEVTISGDVARSARQGDPLTDWVPVVGGSGDIDLSLDDAAELDALGLAFDAATGTISGTLAPNAPVGAHAFVVTATGLQGSASTTVTITVEPRPAALTLTRTGSGEVLQGGSATVEVEVTDTLGASAPVPASDLVVSSDVDSDIISTEDGAFTVTFPHASPHTISVTQISTGLTADIVIEVTELAADGEEEEGLSGTGFDAMPPLGAAAALVLVGAFLVTRRRV